jgi:hypothetical protein
VARAGETLQILQHCLDQGSPDLVGGFLPARRGGISEVRFQLLLAAANKISDRQFVLYPGPPVTFLTRDLAVNFHRPL